jgi:hypothetical protein
MDKISDSDSEDTGSIPVEATKKPSFLRDGFFISHKFVQ